MSVRPSDGQMTEFLGNYSDYQRALGRRQETAPPKAVEAAPVSEVKAAEPRRASDSRTHKSITTVERDIAKLEGKLNELSDALAIASIEADVDALSRLGAEYERVRGRRAEVEHDVRMIEEPGPRGVLGRPGERLGA